MHVLQGFVEWIFCKFSSIKTIKKASLTRGFFEFKLVSWADCTYRANGCAASAIDTCVTDVVLSSTFGNCSDWALRSASATFDTSIADYIHVKNLLILISYQVHSQYNIGSFPLQHLTASVAKRRMILIDTDAWQSQPASLAFASFRFANDNS